MKKQESVNFDTRKRVIIMGATSGLGRSLAQKYIASGWITGVAGRNEKALEELVTIAPDRVFASRIDVLSPDSEKLLRQLIERCGGMDIYLHCSGIAMLTDDISIENEIRICETNAAGFTRLCYTAFTYFSATKSPGRLVAISSIAGVRGLEALPAYSASKAYDSTLLEALRQKADMMRLPLRVVDIKPGWTRTPLLDSEKHYLWEMDSDKVADLIFKASQKAKRSATIGWRWKFLTILERLIPVCVWEKLHIPLWKVQR